MSSNGNNTRTRILKTALTRLQDGAVNLSLGQIAKAAGLSRQAIYLHFRDRADLYIAMVRYFDEQRDLETALRQVEQAPTGRLALAEAVKLQARTNPEVLPVAKALDALRREDPALQRAWDDRLASRLQGARNIAERMSEEGTLREGLDPDTAADLIWTLLSLRTWEDLVVLRHWPADRYVKHLEELLLKTLSD